MKKELCCFNCNSQDSVFRASCTQAWWINKHGIDVIPKMDDDIDINNDIHYHCINCGNEVFFVEI